MKDNNKNILKQGLFLILLVLCLGITIFSAVAEQLETKPELKDNKTIETLLVKVEFHEDYKLKDYDKTIKDCDMAISVNSKDHISYNLRALSYIHINDKKKACSDFTKAIELGSSSAFQNRKTFCK